MKPAQKGTRLIVKTFRHLRPELSRLFVRGQPIFIVRLEAHLRGTTMPDLRPSAAAPRSRAHGGI